MTIQLVTSTKVKTVTKCITDYGIGSLHMWKDINAERYIQVLKKHALPPKNVFFFREGIS